MLPRTVELLESRRLLAAQIVNGELVATGTGGDDSIEFHRVGTDDVQVTFWLGASSTPVSRQVFDLDDFSRARAEGLGGNDTFVFRAGQSNGSVVYEFEGNGAAVGDSLRFVGFGTLAEGASVAAASAVSLAVSFALSPAFLVELDSGWDALQPSR